MNVFKLENLSYIYKGNDKHTLKDINYEFKKGNIYAIIGHSGSGKTTLLSLMSGLESPSEGSIYYDNKDIKEIDKDYYRSNNIGVIFQSFNLLNALTAKENIKLSMDIAKCKQENPDNYIEKLLNKVNISKDLMNSRVLKLSGGQQQRIAIARALSYNPDVILADEPTGALDKKNEQEVMKIFKNLAKKENKCIIIVTHSDEVANEADYIYNLERGAKSSTILY